MDYNQLKVSSSYHRAAGPRVYRARTIVLQDRTNSQFVVSVCYVSLLCQFVVSRFVERGLYACC